MSESEADDKVKPTKSKKKYEVPEFGGLIRDN